MRSVELAKVAAQAEKIRLQRMARRQAMRGVYGAVALVFFFGVLTWLHVALFAALASVMRPVWAALIVVGVDVVVAGILGAMAMRSAPDEVEREAQQVKAQALEEMRESLTLSALALPLGRLLGRRHPAAVAAGGLAAQYFGRRGRRG